MLTFLEVGFGGNLVQGFRAYAWRAVPSFPQIALCFPSFALRPQPFNSYFLFSTFLSLSYPMYLALYLSFLSLLWLPCISQSSDIEHRTYSFQSSRHWNALRVEGGGHLLYVSVTHILCNCSHSSSWQVNWNREGGQLRIADMRICHLTLIEMLIRRKRWKMLHRLT